MNRTTDWVEVNRDQPMPRPDYERDFRDEGKPVHPPAPGGATPPAPGGATPPAPAPPTPSPKGDGDSG